MSVKQKAHTLTKRSKDSTKDARQSDGMLADIVESLEDHKAMDVVVIDLKGKSDIADYMVIATGQSGRQVSTMADRLALVVKDHGVVGAVPEGRGQADWVLLDAIDVIVHLFRPEVRDFYNLEKMWNADLPDTTGPDTTEPDTPEPDAPEPATT
ncbi:MAG: ribosome silencing factor [Alphaproteobacteria bacterium]|nr:ribosome silencing factor [Alphaproteobacteria bacterium]